MGNANIPDDWTGDYIDYVVKWPLSEQWEAILRGQLNNPSFEDFWDLYSGDPSPSMEALWETFDTNLHLQEGAVIPTGTIIDFAGSTIPSGWLVCDFSEVSRTVKARLYAVIGTIFGDGDGTTTFNLPPASGRVNVALDVTDADFNALGEFRGAKSVILEETEMPVHTHVQNAHTHIQNAHTHIQNTHTHIQNAHLHIVPSGTSLGGSTPGYVIRDPLQNFSSAFPNTTSTTATNQNQIATNQDQIATNQDQIATNQNTGVGNAHNNIQPSIVFYRLIKD